MPGRYATPRRVGLSVFGTVGVLVSVLGSTSVAAEQQVERGHSSAQSPTAGQVEKQRKSLDQKPAAESTPQPPQSIHLQADQQQYDGLRDLFIAEGNVKALINGGLLQADRIEFDGKFQTLAARGSVRFRKGSQYFQASRLRFSLIQNEGELEDVYGVLDLDSAALDLGSAKPGESPALIRPPLPVLESSDLGFPTAEDLLLDTTPAEEFDGGTEPGAFLPPQLSGEAIWMVPAPVRAETVQHLGMACPPVLPPIPEWHPHPWAATAWGGQSIDSNFGDTFLFNGRMRPEYLLGVTLQKRIWQAGPFALEVEGNLFQHLADQQAGGGFNQAVPYADTPAQSFGEGILGLGARVWLQPWLSLGVVEGVSYFTANSNYERTYRENYAQLLNYLGFELEAAVSSQLSLVGRIHHRSGAFGTYSGVREGSNAYLIGARYRWGDDPTPPALAVVPPPLGCPDPDRETRQAALSLSEHLQAITLGNGGLPAPRETATGTDLSSTQESKLSPAEQEALRAAAIARIDQRITSIQLQQRFKLEHQQGVPKGLDNDAVEAEREYGDVRVNQLQSPTQEAFITGQISRWRIQAATVQLTRDGWKADRMGFTNDPYTPAQTRLDAEDVVATQDASGDILIQTSRNRLIVEERFAVPVSRSQRIRKEEEVENRWVFGLDNDDRDGFYIGRDLKPIQLGDRFTLALQPQFLVQRSIDGETDSYIAPGSSITSANVTQPTSLGDLFGLEAELTGKVLGWKTQLEADISTFNPSNFADGSRFWAQMKRGIGVPWIGNVQARLFGAYRYRSWNGSLGETDVYSALGGFLEKKGSWNWGKLSNSYLWRVGVGSYQAESFTSNNLSDLWRANAYGSLNSSYPLWKGKPAALSPEAAYRYSPVAIVPGLKLRTNLNSSVSVYGNGTQQSTLSFSGGPVLTLGTFSKPFFDYTELSLSGGGTLKSGASPFAFDEAIDLGTVGVGVVQQIAGPLVISAGVGLNVDPGSPYYGDVIDSNIELRWQRRSYDFGFYFNPYEGIGGFRFRLNDFNFTGTGVPFVPYTPRNRPTSLNERPF